MKMKVRLAWAPARLLALAAVSTLAAPLAATAADGLLPPSADTLWPQWQARIAVQSAAVSPLALLRPLESESAQRGATGASVLGDYIFANPSFGAFRASGGVMFGAMGGVPLLSAAPSPRLGLAVQSGSALQPGENPGTVPYVGLGFSSAWWGNSLSLTADLGMVAEQPSAMGGVGRAVFGNQGMQNALREMRLAPVLQLGLRYTF